VVVVGLVLGGVVLDVRISIDVGTREQTEINVSFAFGVSFLRFRRFC
jgi:hypothetical protein